MMLKSEKNDLLIKYQRLFQRYEEGGIFHKKTQDRLLGIATPYGGGRGEDESSRRTRANFWRRVRNHVKSALIDLELFIETGEENVTKVVNLETLKPVFDRYFVDLFQETKIVIDERTGEEMIDWLEEPDIIKAELAQYLIKIAFNYLGNMQGNYITESNQRTMFEAYDLARYLVELFKPEGKRRYYRDFVELR